MSALIGALRVSLSADTAQFEAGMKRAQRSTSTAASGIQKSAGLIRSAVTGLIGGLSVGLFLNAAKEALEYAGSLSEVSKTLGVTTKDLQTFRYAAGQSGVAQDELEVGLRRLTVSMGKAQLGSSAQAKAFAAIGISLDQLKGKNTGEVFRLMADGLSKVSDRSQRAAIEMMLMGRSGSTLDNLLAPGSKRLNELAKAAEELGIVLSDEQIQRAEETAHKLEALKTVLSAQIAGLVADNADSILHFANSLATLSAKAIQALKSLREFLATLERAHSLNLASLFGGNAIPDNVKGLNQVGRSVTLQLPPARVTGKGSSLSPFLGGGGGGGSHHAGRADHSAEDALRKAHQFDQDLRRAQMDVLHATQDLATDYVERTSIGIEILNAEKAAYESDLQYQVASKDITKAQADQLRAQNDKTDALKRQALLEEEQAHRQQDVAMLIQTDFDTQKDKLQSELQLATTAKEQRDVQLQLLDLSYRQERARLEAVLADEKASEAAKEDARRRLLGLKQTYANDRQGVVNSTRNPMEAWAASVPQTAQQITEAFQQINADGLESISQGLAGVISGTESMGQAMQQVAQQMIAEITRIIIKMILLKAIQAATGTGGMGGGIGGIGASPLDISSAPVGSMSGGLDLGMVNSLPGFASGGRGVFGGMAGNDNNILSMNGLPIARVSRGEPWAIGPHAMPSGGVVINQHFGGNPTRETMNQVAARTRSAIAGANRAGV